MWGLVDWLRGSALPDDFCLDWPVTNPSNVCDPAKECRHTLAHAILAEDLLSGDGPHTHFANQYLHPPKARGSS